MGINYFLNFILNRNIPFLDWNKPTPCDNSLARGCDNLDLHLY